MWVWGGVEVLSIKTKACHPQGRVSIPLRQGSPKAWHPLDIQEVLGGSSKTFMKNVYGKRVLWKKSMLGFPNDWWMDVSEFCYCYVWEAEWQSCLTPWSLNVSYSLAWDRSRPGKGSLFQVFPVGGRDLTTCSVTCFLHRVHVAKKLESRTALGLEHGSLE